MPTVGWCFRALILLASAAWFAGATYLASDALTGFFGVVVLLFFGMLIAIGWCGATLAWLEVFRSLRRAVIWLAVPSAPVIAWIGFDTRWPMAVRVCISERELRSQAEWHTEHPVDWYAEGPGRVGHFEVNAVHRRGSILLFATDSAWLNIGGVAYVPDAGMLKEVEPPLYLLHLYGPWYSFVLLD